MFNKFLFLFTALLFAFVFFGCSERSENKQNESTNSISYQKIRFDFQDGNCGGDSIPGVRLSTNFLITSDSSKAGLAINSFIENFIVRNIHSNTDSAFIESTPSNANPIKAAYESLRNSYFDFKKTFPDSPGCWEIEMNGDTIFTSPKVISYGLAQYSYLGGAHPNTFTSFYLFDPETGNELNPLDFFADTSQFLKIVETTFRRVENLPPTSNLENKGYFLQDGKFFLPANFIFSNKGVLIHYNPYEIAPYVKGPISFTIPYSELKGNLKEELIF